MRAANLVDSSLVLLQHSEGPQDSSCACDPHCVFACTAAAPAGLRAQLQGARIPPAHLALPFPLRSRPVVHIPAPACHPLPFPGPPIAHIPPAACHPLPFCLPPNCAHSCHRLPQGPLDCKLCATCPGISSHLCPFLCLFTALPLHHNMSPLSTAAANSCMCPFNVSLLTYLHSQPLSSWAQPALRK